MKTPRLFPVVSRSVLSRTGAVLVAVAIALTGCSAGGSDKDSSDAGGEKSPLEKYLGYSPNQPGSGGSMMMVSATRSDKLSEDDKAKMRRVQEHIASCMRKQGFEYVPEAPPKEDPAADSGPGSLSPEEFAKKYGYGIATMNQQAADKGSGGSSANDEIRAKLSEEARRAYDEALLGEGATGAGDGGVVMQESDDGGSDAKAPKGCEAKAHERVYGKPKEFDPKSHDALFEDLDSLGRRIAGDPKVKKAEKAYADCLADAGHPGYAKPGAAQEAVWKKYDKVATPAGDGKPQPVDPKKLEPVKKLELELAPIDLTCRKKHYDKAYRAVQIPMEKEFVAQHKLELERYKEAAGQGGGQGSVVVGPAG